MRVKMLTDAPGSPDGVTINEYVEGDVYNVTDQLGEVFVQHELAEDIGPEAPSTTSKPEPEPRGGDTSSKKVAPTENK